MSRLEDLAPDQQAVIGLVVRQGRSYAQVASLLGLDEASVRRRAHAAVAGLGRTRDGLAGGDVDRVADYLLGQADESARLATLLVLIDSPSLRAWARGVAGQLEPIASSPLPAVPEEPDRPPQSPAADDPGAAPAGVPAPPVAARPRRTPSPREGDRGAGVLLLAALALVAAIVVYVVNPGGSSAPPRGPIPASLGTTTTTAATGSTSTDAASTSILGEVKLSATVKGSSATGVAALVKTGSGVELAFSASGLPAPGTGHYVLVLYNSSTSLKALGEVPSVSASGAVGPLAVPLPANAASYRGIALTLEGAGAGTAGEVVLSGSSSSGF